MNYWLIKSEPSVYSWEQLQRDGVTCWDGVRNHAARLHLLAMKPGDFCLYYHSNEGLEIVGIASVVQSAYPDPTTDDPRWVAVDVQAHRPLPKPVSLKTMKDDPLLKNMELIRQSRLSVSPVRQVEFEHILTLSEL